MPFAVNEITPHLLHVPPSLLRVLPSLLRVLSFSHSLVTQISHKKVTVSQCNAIHVYIQRCAWVCVRAFPPDSAKLCFCFSGSTDPLSVPTENKRCDALRACESRKADTSRPSDPSKGRDDERCETGGGGSERGGRGFDRRSAEDSLRWRFRREEGEIAERPVSPFSPIFLAFLARKRRGIEGEKREERADAHGGLSPSRSWAIEPGPSPARVLLPEPMEWKKNHSRSRP